MKNILRIILLVCFAHYANAQSASTESPNIIIIYADDLGYGDLSSYGGDIPTPNIDRIGKEGIRFTDFYVAAPVCTPSRYALLTGSYPNRSQHLLQNVLFPLDVGYLDKSETTLAEYLKTKGYATAVTGKWHLGAVEESAFPTRHGFDQFHGFEGGCIDFYHHTYGSFGPDWFVNNKPKQEEGFATDLITNHAIKFIRDSKAKSSPFFLYLSYNAPHYGKSDPDNLPENTVVLNEAKYQGYKMANTLQAPVEYVNRFSHVKDPYRKMYSAMLSSLDDNVGRILAELESRNLLDNTMVWFISDNGGYSQTHHAHASNGDLRGQKGSVWEGGIRVPALLFWRQKIKSNQVVSTPICNVDIVPTMANIVGFNDRLPNGIIDGKDISKVLFDGEKLEREIFWRFNKQTAIRKGDWKLVNGTELYNLSSDRSERVNLASQHPEKVKELRASFEEINSTIDQP